MGYAVDAAAEYEFFLFEETPHSRAREGLPRADKTMTPGYFGYSVLRSSVHAELYQELLRTRDQKMRIPIEGLHTETGPGVLEAALSYGEALEAADRAALFKTFAKVLAQRHGLMATFMAKWSETLPGQSGHLHVSLRRHGRRVCFLRCRPPPHNMSRDDALVHRRPAGADARAARHDRPHRQQLLAPRFPATGRRPPLPGASRIAPARCGSSGVAPRRSASSTAIAAADINPYIALAAAIGSGLWGIEHAHRARPRRSSATLTTASCRRSASCPLRSSEAAAAPERIPGRAQALFGAPFVDHYAATPRVGGAGVPQARSRTGSWRATSRSSDEPRLKTITRSTAASMSSAPLPAEARSTRRSSERTARSSAGATAGRRARPRSCERFVDAFVRQGADDRRARSPGRWAGRSAHRPARCAAFAERARYMMRRAPRRRSPTWTPAPKPGFRRFIRRVPLGRGVRGGALELSVSDRRQRVVPALMAGNAVLLKHSAPDAAVRRALCRSLRSRGLPAGVFQYLHLTHADTAR